MFRIRIGLYVDPDPAICLNLVIILLVGFGQAYAARTRLFRGAAGKAAPF